MMNKSIVSLLLAMLAWSGSGTGEPGQPRTDIIREAFPADQAAITKVLADLMEAAEKKDLDRLDSFHLYGPKFSKFDDSGGDRQDAASCQAAERNGLTAVKSFRGTIENLKVDVFGPVAVATFILNYSVEVNERSFSSKARSTIVFANDGGHWRMVHEHHSSLTVSPLVGRSTRMREQPQNNQMQQTRSALARWRGPRC